MNLDSAYESIVHALETGRVAHAYLVVGALRGDAMRLAVRVLEKIFPGHVADHLHPDVHWVYPEKQSRIISVDAVREKIVAPMALTAYEGGWKAVVVVGADCLKTEGANAFLKTLEEPPPKTIFFLLAENAERLLPTIVSRCQRVDLPRTDADAEDEPWKTRLLDVLAADDLASATARAAAAGDLQGILQDLAERAEAEVSAEKAHASDSGEVISKDAFNGLVKARYREYRAQFLAVFMSWFRDLTALVCAPGETTPLVNGRRRTALAARARRLTRVQAFRDVEAVEDGARMLERNVQELPALSFLMDRLAYGVEKK